MRLIKHVKEILRIIFFSKKTSALNVKKLAVYQCNNKKPFLAQITKF